jgi:mRNA-degrading endonuclease RelE of RelBE toxin-antitoxin system
MPFPIELSKAAKRHLLALKPRDRNIVLDAVEAQLLHEPLVETRHRKPLRENPLATWELQVGDFRVFYDFEAEGERPRVVVNAVGVKQHNRLFIEEKEFKL